MSLGQQKSQCGLFSLSVLFCIVAISAVNPIHFFIPDNVPFHSRSSMWVLYMSLHNFLNIWNIVALSFIYLLILIFVLVLGQFLLMDFFFFSPEYGWDFHASLEPW